MSNTVKPIKLGIHTGLRAFQPYDHTDDVIYFNPGDPGIAVRLEKAGDRISEGIKALREQDTDTKKLEEIGTLFCDQLNYVFGFNVSDVLFKDFHPLSFDGDHFLVESILTAICGIIAEESKGKIEKYTAKYTKK